jgi:hypothetical protein
MSCRLSPALFSALQVTLLTPVRFEDIQQGSAGEWWPLKGQGEANRSLPPRRQQGATLRSPRLGLLLAAGDSSAVLES